MFVLSSPSGAGKTTLSRRLLEHNPDMSLSVSATTRAPRKGEQDGVDYYFLSPEDFEDMKNKGEFLEWAHVFHHDYGTPKQPVEQALSTGYDILFDIDWQGAQQLTQQAADDLVKIFILPPDLGELEDRLRRRAQDDETVITRRMARSSQEISHWAEYDYVLVNDDLERTLEALQTLIIAERLKRKRQVWLHDFVKKLMV